MLKNFEPLTLSNFQGPAEVVPCTLIALHNAFWIFNRRALARQLVYYTTLFGFCQDLFSSFFNFFAQLVLSLGNFAFVSSDFVIVTRLLPFVKYFFKKIVA